MRLIYFVNVLYKYRVVGFLQQTELDVIRNLKYESESVTERNIVQVNGSHCGVQENIIAYVWRILIEEIFQFVDFVVTAVYPVGSGSPEQPLCSRRD